MSESLRELLFYFDFSSPFAYLGASQVERVAHENNAVVRYRPFLLGGLFRDIGTPNVPLFEASEQKRRHYLADMARFADVYGIPIRFPSGFPINTVKPLRMVLGLPEDERKRLVHPMFHAIWALDLDVSQDGVLCQIASEAGFPGAALLAEAQSEAGKARLKEATSQAAAKGVCGAPCFFVGGRMFWGQDRLLFVEKALQGWLPPCDLADAESNDEVSPL